MFTVGPENLVKNALYNGFHRSVDMLSRRLAARALNVFARLQIWENSGRSPSDLDEETKGDREIEDGYARRHRNIRNEEEA